MGSRGPKPKPTYLRLLEGNPGRASINKNEPECDLPPVKPNVVGMDELASSEWDRLAKVCPPKLFTALDTAALTVYCLAWSMLVKAQADLDENGIVIKQYAAQPDKHGNRVLIGAHTNPSARLWKAATEAILKSSDRLGLVPTARSRLQLPTRDDKPTSKFAGLIPTGE